MVFEQVDLIDIEKATMRPGQQSRLEGLLAAAQYAFQVERADDPVFSGSERKLDHRNRDESAFEFAHPFARAAFRALRRMGGRIATKTAPGNDAHGG